MQFHSSEYASQLKREAEQKKCLQDDPHCPKMDGDLCEKGCFEVTVDLQTMTIVKDV